MADFLTIVQCLSERKAISFDTNVLIDLWNSKERERGTIPPILAQIRPGYRYISIVSIWEFLSGVGEPQQEERLEWLKENGMKTIRSTAKALEILRKWTERRAFQAGIADGLIAAAGFEKRFALATRNVEHFESIEGLVLVSDFIKGG